MTVSLILCSFLVQSQAVWEEMAPCPAAGRFWAAATGNSTHGYCGTGRLQFAGLNNQVSDMYAYELASDTWTQISDYPGGVREGMTGFTIGERIFFAFGSPFIQFTKTIYEYLPESNTWNQMPDVPGIGFAFSEGFVIDDTFYIGPENGTNTVYTFNASTNTWGTAASFPGNDRRHQCTFTANGKGYLGMGAGVFGGVYGDWWEYDPIADSWNEIASMSPHADQACATAVSNTGYLYNTGGGGFGGQNLYSYNAEANEWVFESTKPDDRVANSAAMTIGDQGFVVFGEESTTEGNFPANKLWRFSPNTSAIGEYYDNSIQLNVIYTSQGVVIRSQKEIQENGLFELYTIGGQLVYQRALQAGSPLNIQLNSDLPGGIYTARCVLGSAISAIQVFYQ